jgi:hypothetical protein
MTIVKLPGDAGFLTFREDREAVIPPSMSMFQELGSSYTSRENTMDLHELVDGYLEESKIDYVGLWQIAQASKEELGAGTTDQVRKLSLEIVKLVV